MKAEGFISKHGLDAAKANLNPDFDGKDAQIAPSSILNDLKRLVESHELVESYGGLEQAKEHAVNVEMGVVELSSREWGLLGAIADVESCMEVSNESN